MCTQCCDRSSPSARYLTSWLSCRPISRTRRNVRILGCPRKTVVSCLAVAAVVVFYLSSAVLTLAWALLLGGFGTQDPCELASVLHLPHQAVQFRRSRAAIAACDIQGAKPESTAYECKRGVQGKLVSGTQFRCSFWCDLAAGQTHTLIAMEDSAWR
jgi:hypothetical protein